MNLLIKTIDIINKNKYKYKSINIPDNILLKKDDLIYINKVLHKFYDKHTNLSTYSNLKSNHNEVDELPKITIKNNTCAIKFYDINGSYIDYLKNPKEYINYKTKSKYGKRIKEIVEITQNVCDKYDNIIIDFTSCGGGDFDAFCDAFKILIGTGLMYYYDEKNYSEFCYYDGNKVINSNEKLNIKQIKPDKEKNIIIKVNKNTASSAEFISMMIKTAYPQTKIIGKSGGFLSKPKSFLFNYNNQQYALGLTVAPYIMNSNHQKYTHVSSKS